MGSHAPATDSTNALRAGPRLPRTGTTRLCRVNTWSSCWPPLLAALAVSSAVWPVLGLPAAFLSFIGVLALPRRPAPGARGARLLLALSVACASVGLLRFVVEVAMPGIVRGGRAAAEQRAVSWLRDVSFAQDAMRKAGWIDPDADGVGSAASLGELCSGDPRRGQSARPSGVLTCGELIETPLGLAARRGGYLFTVCLPLRGGGWSATSTDLDEEAAERSFIAYAWPDADGRFDDAFFLDQDENIQQLALPEGTALSCDSAHRLRGWKPWRGKRPRQGPLPGSAPERGGAVR